MPIAIIFAAGKGSRMSPLTDTLPKPLAKVRNKTLLEINLEKLAGSVESYIIIVSHLKQQIQDFILDSFAGKPVYYAVQENPKGGTLDAFRVGLNKAKELGLSSSGYLVSGSDDILEDSIYKNLFQAITKNPEKAYLMGKKIEDKELLKSKGVFLVNAQNQLIKIIEKPSEFVSDLTNIGLYYLPKQIISSIPKKDLAKDKEEYITDLFNTYTQQNPVHILPTHGQYFSISNLEDLAKANQIFKF